MLALAGLSSTLSASIATPSTVVVEGVEWGPGVVAIQGGVPVTAGADPGELLLVEVLASEVATTIHTGPHDGLGDAHAALDVLLHENGLKSGRPTLEVYLTDPGEVPDPTEWKTLVQKPIAA
ncbi:MAG: GyrI-like domain-containing protein [Myxococcota bacterium]